MGGGGANAQDIFQNTHGLFPGVQGRIQETAGAATFFARHLTWGGKVDKCGRDDLFFFAHDFGPEKWRSADVMTFFLLFT